MKKALFALFLFFSPIFASAQYSYISSTGYVILESGASIAYTTPDIYINGAYNTISGQWSARMQLFAAGTTERSIATYELIFDNASIDAFTAAGSTNTQKAKSCLIQAVTAYLTSLNESVFTIH